MWEEGFAARELRDLFEDVLTFQVEQPIFGSPGLHDTDAINLHAGFLQRLAQFVVGVARRIVLTIRDEQQRALAMAGLLDFFKAEVRSIVERRLPTWVNQTKLALKRGAIGELSEQAGALIETDEEEVVVVVLDLPAFLRLRGCGSLSLLRSSNH